MAQKTHLPCPDCGSSDALLDDVTHTHCFSCGAHKYKDTKTLTNVSVTQKLDLFKDRGITDETAEKYGVYTSDNDINFPYYSRDGKQQLAVKHRRRMDKKFNWTGLASECGLFGAWLFQPGCDKQITVVEGELDALAASQMQNNKYPVVSVRNGVSGAYKDCAEAFEYLNSFEQIVICFDKDEGRLQGERMVYPGQEAALAVASMFKPGKVRVLTLQKHKDANDYLINGHTAEYIEEWWDAPTFTPAGLKLGSQMWDEIRKPKNYETVQYPWDGLNWMTYGIRLSEFVLINAPPKVGKTTIMKELEYNILKSTDKAVGFLHFEEPNSDTTLGLMSIEASKPLHLPDIRETVDDKELRKYYDDIVNTDRVVIFDAFGSRDIHVVLEKIRHMAALGCRYIFIDHLSIIVSDQSGDERKQLDEISTKIKMLCMELNVAVIAVIHQSRSGEIRGSMGPEQLANIVIKLIRDKLEKDEWRRNVTQVLVTDNRFCGRTGPACYLYYDGGSGRMTELTEEQVRKFEEGLGEEVWR